jgi:patatin-like phospholipase/acyl hydrolase
MQSASRFQILALDGGGAKALFTAHVLARLEDDLGARVQDVFDLIAGTSAGGVIALALGAGIPPAEIVDRYSSLIASVFPRHRRAWWALPIRLARPAYAQAALRTALEGVFGETKLGDSRKRLLIPTWDVQNGGVYLFKTPHHPHLRRDWKLSMVDVALATTAAPTYFPAAAVDGQRFIDGGVWANNPSVVAITEAVRTLGVSLDAIRVLNVGTTNKLLGSSKKLDDAGIGQWASKAVPLVLDANSRGGQATAQNLLGKERYHRFDALVHAGMYALDKVDARELAGVASSASRALAPDFTTYFADHIAPPFVADMDGSSRS